LARVEFLTDGTREGRDLFVHRARLLRAASQQHEREEFAASIMTVLAQVEGITAQVTAPAEGGEGKLFFTKRDGRKADVVDTSDLASIRPSMFPRTCAPSISRVQKGRSLALTSKVRRCAHD
jgi:hypothetical protein